MLVFGVVGLHPAPAELPDGAAGARHRARRPAGEEPAARAGAVRRRPDCRSSPGRSASSCSLLVAATILIERAIHLQRRARGALVRPWRGKPAPQRLAHARLALQRGDRRAAVRAAVRVCQGGSATTGLSLRRSRWATIRTRLTRRAACRGAPRRDRRRHRHHRAALSAEGAGRALDHHRPDAGTRARTVEVMRATVRTLRRSRREDPRARLAGAARARAGDEAEGAQAWSGVLRGRGRAAAQAGCDLLHRAAGAQPDRLHQHGRGSRRRSSRRSAARRCAP